MKAILMYCALVASSLAAQPLIPRITPEELAKLQQADPMVRLQKPAEGEAKVGRPAEQSLIGQSTILSDGNRWTLVPKGAVLHLPERHKNRVEGEPAGQLVPWLEFLSVNRIWLDTCEVSFDQAAGKSALPVASTEHWPKQDKIIIAVHQRGPISVRPMQSPNPPTP
jgi:hypothetical protein